MKEIRLLLSAFTAFLISGCASDGPAFSSSEESSSSDSFLLSQIQNNIVFDEIYKDGDGAFQKGIRCLHHFDGETKTAGFASLRETDDGFEAGSYYYYYADASDSSDRAYSESIGPDNAIHKTYLEGDNGYVSFSMYYANPFAALSDSDLVKNDERLLFANEDAAIAFASSFVSDAEDASIYFSLDGEAIASFEIEGDDYSLSCLFVSSGDEVSSHHLSPFEPGEGDKEPLRKAIESLAGTYTATHYRQSTKSIVYYAENEIVYDDGADSLSSRDTYYSLGEDGYMHRTVYGREEGVGPFFWDPENYAEMSYGDDAAYDELKVRLDEVNPDLFYEKKEGEYVSVDGAAGTIFPYAQPAMNERALYTEGASKVTIIVEDGAIERIKLSYIKDAYGTGGSDATDTIFITDVGTAAIPEEYRKSINADSLSLSDDLIGTYEGHPDGDEETTVSLSIAADRTTIYKVGEAQYEIAHLYYYEGDEIKIAFDYGEEDRRYVLLTLSDGELSGYDSSYDDLTDFFNLTLVKSS